MTPWEHHQHRETRLRFIREARRMMAIRRLEMIYCDITRIKTFIRIDKDGTIRIRQSFQLPSPALFIQINIQ